MVAEDFVIAECAQKFIDESGRDEFLGDTSSVMCELEEHGIISPPEQLFYAAARTFDLSRWATIYPQYELGKYRADFMIDPLGFFETPPGSYFPSDLLESLGNEMKKFVVEVDGTPEQAENDKRRDRFIQQQGYGVYRYAAREVLRDPVKCVTEIRSLVLEEIRVVGLKLRIS